MKKLSSSFVTGAVALVFAVVGYETALLVHYSATASIIAGRDTPDTVYIYRIARDSKEPGSPDPGTASGSYGSSRKGQPSGVASSRRASGKHPVQAQNIRRNVPPRKVESFRFDPNSVSEEDLVRLGFSPKQAASIDNYRRKGGRFRRREDFARSFVVSDSIYKRLEAYIDIPLTDINVADSAAFDALPGIGGYYARKIVQYRSRLRGFSCPEQLMDLKGFDEEKFDGLKDLICVSAPEPYPLWRFPADSLRRHPYIGDAARSIVFFRENNPKGEWSIKNLVRAGILPQDQAMKLKKCVLEDP